MEETETSEVDLSSSRINRHQVCAADFDLVALAGRGAFGKVGRFN